MSTLLTANPALATRQHARQEPSLYKGNTGSASRRLSHVARRRCKRCDISVAAGSAIADLEPLKRKLMEMTATLPDFVYWTEEARPVLDSINDAVSAGQAPEITAESIRGKYKQVLTSSILVDGDSTTTLGKLCFNQFEPKDLKIKLLDVHLLQGVDFSDQYSTVVSFEVLEGDLEGVVGEQKLSGRYEVKGEQRGRQDVFFSSIQIAAKESRFSGAWVTALSEVNENMDESGIATASFPKEMAGFRDFKICDDDVTVSVGNRGSYVVVVPQ